MALVTALLGLAGGVASWGKNVVVSGRDVLDALVSAPSPSHPHFGSGPKTFNGGVRSGAAAARRAARKRRNVRARASKRARRG